jgi:hypothetical protein
MARISPSPFEPTTPSALTSSLSTRTSSDCKGNKGVSAVTKAVAEGAHDDTRAHVGERDGHLLLADDGRGHLGGQEEGVRLDDGDGNGVLVSEVDDFIVDAESVAVELDLCAREMSDPGPQHAEVADSPGRRCGRGARQ